MERFYSFKKGIRRGYVENNIEVIEIELQLSNNFSLLKPLLHFAHVFKKPSPESLRPKK